MTAAQVNMHSPEHVHRLFTVLIFSIIELGGIISISAVLVHVIALIGMTGRDVIDTFFEHEHLVK